MTTDLNEIAKGWNFEQANNAARAVQTARKYGIPEEEFVLHLWLESGLKSGDAKHGNGGGVGQFIATTAQSYGYTQDQLRNDPETALDIAGKLMADNYKAVGGDWNKAFAAYFVGPDIINEASSSGDDWLAAADTIFARRYPNETAQGTVSSYVGARTGQSSGSAKLPRTAGKPAANSSRTTGSPGFVQPTLDDFTDNDPNSPTYGQQDVQAYNRALAEYNASQKSEGDDYAQYFDAVIGAQANEIAAGNANVSKSKMEFDRQLQAHDTAQSGFTQLMGYALPAGQEYVTGREPGGFWENRGVSPLKASGLHFDPFAAANDIVARTPNLTQINTAPTNTLLPSYITQARSIAAGRTGAAPAAPPSTPPPPPGGPGAPGARTAEQIAQDFINNQQAQYQAAGG